MDGWREGGREGGREAGRDKERKKEELMRIKSRECRKQCHFDPFLFIFYSPSLFSSSSFAFSFLHIQVALLLMMTVEGSGCVLGLVERRTRQEAKKCCGRLTGWAEVMRGAERRSGKIR